VRAGRISFFNNSRGVSLLELMIGGALVGGIVMITVSLSKSMTEEIAKVDERADVVMDQAGVTKSISDDVLNSVPAYNFLKSQTATTNQGDDFWTMWVQSDTPKTLKIDANGKCLSILSLDNSKIYDLTAGTVTQKKTLLATPSYFYNPRTSMTSPLVFDSAKLNNLLIANKLNISGQLFKLSGMMPVHDTAGFYKDYGIILKLNASGRYVEDTTSVATYSAPTTCTSTTTSLDNFLRCLPSPGGGTVNLYITPVLSIKYCLKTGNGQTKGFDLYRTKNGRETLVGNRLKSVELLRTKLSNPIININLAFCQINDKSSACN